TTTTPAKTTATTTAQTTTTPAKTTASTTTQTVTTSVTEVTQPQELHTSDMDNPNMITITTKINERGYYEDVFEYQFYDDPMVHGKWRWLTTIPTYMFAPQLTAYKLNNYNYYGEHLLSTLFLGDNGLARVYPAEGMECVFDAYWTNGFLIYELVDGTVAQSMFEVTIDGEEFLFVAAKMGDYLINKEADVYEVYIREE
ncbi:MAG: hypothetical protein ACI4XA_09860, partial [Oscillospiraceae bacterium]